MSKEEQNLNNTENPKLGISVVIKRFLYKNYKNKLLHLIFGFYPMLILLSLIEYLINNQLSFGEIIITYSLFYIVIILIVVISDFIEYYNYYKRTGRLCYW